MKLHEALMGNRLQMDRQIDSPRAHVTFDPTPQYGLDYRSSVGYEAEEAHGIRENPRRDQQCPRNQDDDSVYDGARRDSSLTELSLHSAEHPQTLAAGQRGSDDTGRGYEQQGVESSDVAP